MVNTARNMAVVMPVRNYAAAAMKRCIESLRRQESDPAKLDILIADYGSSSEHAAAVKELATATGARYVWFDEKGPWNRSRAINLGVRATTAPIVVTSDADLVFPQNFTETVLGLLDTYVGREVYAYAPMMDLPESITIDLDDYEADYKRLLAVAKERVWSRGNVIFSRALFERMRGWEEAYEIWGCEDNDFFDRAKRSGAAVVDLKGVTSYLHHWHISNKRGAAAAAQVARNQVMCWPVEGRTPVIRTGAFAGDGALAEHKAFQLPSVAILINGNDAAKIEVTRAAIAAQTYPDVQVVAVPDAGAVSAALQQRTEDVVGLMQAGDVFPKDDALAWRVLIPLLKGETPPASFMWRTPRQYTGERQIVPGAAKTPAKTKVVLVTYALGRCGSSATMGMLKLMGVNVGAEERLVGAQAMNPKGFFELKSQEQFLRQAYAGYYPSNATVPPPAAVASAAEQWTPAFLQMVQSEFAQSGAIALKTQRGLALPFWDKLRDRYDIRVLLLSRNPDDQVRSIQKIWAGSNDAQKNKATKDDIAADLNTWRAFMERQLAQFPFPQMSVEFDVMLKDPRGMAQKMAAFLGIPAPSEAAVNDWIDAKLVNRKENTPLPTQAKAKPAPLFGNYGATTTHSMSEPIKAAMLFSRAPIRNEQDLAEAVAAEKTLGEMNDADFAALKAQRAENRTDPYFFFWAGLVHLQRREPVRAQSGFSAALQGGLNHPRVVKAAALAEAMLTAKQSRREALGSVTRNEAAARLTEHFVRLTPLPESVPVVRSAPHLLLHARRFDIAVKYLYASYQRHRIQTDFAKRAYLAHIEVFNGFNEGDGSKSNAAAFIANFDSILASVAADGFKAEASAVPIDRHGVPMDGAHRVAACLAYDRPVTCLQLPGEGAVYDYRYFRDRTKFVAGGLDAHYADAAALAYAKLKTNTHIVNLFPAAVGRDADVEAILGRYGRIVYAKHVTIGRNAVPLLMRHIYEQEPWLGDWSNNFKGAQNKGGRCFDGDGPLRVYLIETDTPEKLRACKEEIRALYQIGATKNGQDAVHINDTHAETVLLARTYFNANSIAFLNSAKPQAFDAFNQQFARYRQSLKAAGVDTDHFCIEGSAIMAAYGIRASRDLDYLSLGDMAPDFGTKLIGNHASELKHHVLGRDQIIFDPANHFYFFGMKIATLDVLRGMKAKRAEKPKDFSDIALIDAFTGGAPEASTKQPTGSMAHRDRYEDVYRLLGGKAKVIVDGGANKGTVTWKLREQYPDAVVHAFEPIPELGTRLVRVFKDDPQVIVHIDALGERRERKTFQVTNNLVSSSLFTPGDTIRKYHGAKVEVSESVPVTVVALADVLSDPVIDLIKLDLQGGELAALKGCGADVLNRTKIIVAEAMFAEVYKGQPLFADIDAFLRAHGFRLYNLYDLFTQEDGQLLQGDAVYLNTRFFT